MGFLEQDFWNIYRQITRYTNRIKCVSVPFEDISQEIYIALLTDKNNALRAAAVNIGRLYKGYGYSKKLNAKDAFDPRFIYTESNTEEYYESVEEKLAELKRIYKSSSARNLCDYYGVALTDNISQRLSIVFGKRQQNRSTQTPFSRTKAIEIIEAQGLNRRCLRDWKWKGYIPKKYLLTNK